MSELNERMAKVRPALTARRAGHVEKIQTFLRMPHVGDGMRETAAQLAERLREIGCGPVETFETKGFPILYAPLDAGAPVTLLVYLMYDTAPVLDLNGWTHPPFAADVVATPRGRAIVARGALARRGPAITFLETVAAIRDAGMRLPVNLLFVAEGDENIGSPHLPEFYAAYAKKLAAASGTLFPAASQEAQGGAVIRLGAKGMLGLELTCDAAAWGQGPAKTDLHWANGAWIDSPMWRLAHAVTTLVSADGSRILVDGFYENVAPISNEDRATLRALPFDGAKQLDELGAQRFSGGVSGWEALARNLYEPMAVLEGLWGSIPPIPRLYRKATCRLDMRTIFDQTADEVEAKVRAHLDRRSYADISVNRLYALPASRVRRDEPVVRAAVETYADFGIRPQLWPSQPRTPPTSVFERPHVMFGAGHGGNQAAPDEYLLLDSHDGLCGIDEMAASFAAFLFRYAELTQNGRTSR
jgi:acetylornithine deacetylase/succinyl-diaminopimelate desuccinylase-like protein